MLIKHTNSSAPLTPLLVFLIFVLPAITIAADIQGILLCGVWRSPLEADTAAKRAMIRSVADVAVDRLCHTNRTKFSGSLLNNYCADDEWSEDGSTHVMIDLITRNNVRQDRISAGDCLELFDKVLKGCVDGKWEEGTFTEMNGSRVVNVVYEQHCDSSPTGWCG